MELKATLGLTSLGGVSTLRIHSMELKDDILQPRLTGLMLRNPFNGIERPYASGYPHLFLH